MEQNRKVANLRMMLQETLPRNLEDHRRLYFQVRDLFVRKINGGLSVLRKIFNVRLREFYKLY